MTREGAKSWKTLGAALTLLAGAAGATLATSSSAAATERPVVATVEGPVLGLEHDGVDVFTAIPQFTESDPVQEEPLARVTELPNAAYHTSEEAYIFDGDHAHAALTGNAATLSAMMRGYWTSFAKTGDPDGGGRPRWPRFSPGNPALLSLQDVPRVTTRFAERHNCANLEGAGLISVKELPVK